ncbi:MAG: glycosyltransferase, partial [Ferruginibacter sp.]
YGLTEKFILSPNQFWMHKNHQVILDALLLLQQEQFNCKIVFTGKEFDHRNPDYVNGLKAFVEKNQLGDLVKFLGFIDRQDQLQLMQLSKAVLQPSKFEGWSTVVEDAKALNKPIIASAIPVHREQLGAKGYFFECDDAASLATLLKKIFESELPEPDYHYEVDCRQFAEDFYQLITKTA